MVTYLDSTYQEALSLTKEARDYLANRASNRHPWLKPEDRLQICCESMRLTTRLTQVVAWLLMQRAVLNGEVSLDEARKPDNRISGQGVCEPSDKLPDGADPRMVDLMGRSHQLYMRVARLDSQLDRADRAKKKAP
ncbi:hypothetical protein WH95_13700 [Kiloniella litopenaei]|uniref:Regulator of CtrA degradation rcdA n=1 Tax=Kiloniella litopenaei TaxID=1549748 RepID=A0A0M2R328_9PROT|nr:DUF1465 family protein [Kiloniella litopenaei]KKJ76272.1 hypothetical protein WH95_13700 [Kiloniella litopenaei]